MNQAAPTRDFTALRAARAAPPGRFFAGLVLKALVKMQAGCLRLTTPDGAEHLFGTPGAEIEAAMQVRDWGFFKKCVLFGDVGFGESYVDGDWETPSIERVIAWAILNVENSPGASGSKVRNFAFNVLKVGNRFHHLLRRNTRRTSRRNIAEHYDLGNDFYALWLDRTMTYSSALFRGADDSLEAAQDEKYERLCRQLRLQPTDRVLEIGCGWGGFSAYAARHYGCHITAVTISPAQQAFAAERMRREKLDDRVEIQLRDYREITGRFDKIVSIEMMEALGDRYLEKFCAQLGRMLQPHGIVALQFITVPDARHAELRSGIDFIQKHIFPGSLLLSVGRVNEALNRTGQLFLHDLKDFGASYARTLRCWWESFNARAAEVGALGFDRRFLRKWNYYLQYCEAAFALRNISVVQVTYAAPNNRHFR